MECVTPPPPPPQPLLGINRMLLYNYLITTLMGPRDCGCGDDGRRCGAGAWGHCPDRDWGLFTMNTGEGGGGGGSSLLYFTILGTLNGAER